MYEETTRSIRISVEPQFLQQQSRAEDNYFVWAYTITIENGGDEEVTLRSRHWKITDARGHTQEVREAGVVGEQPNLKPGEKFQYTSGAPLPTPSGFMMGTFQMEAHDGSFFDVVIPGFSLDSPLGNTGIH